MGVTTWTETQDAILLNGLKSDQTYTQIADKLGVSKAMVSGRIHRLRKLRPLQFLAKQSTKPNKKPKPKIISGKKSKLKLNWQTPSIPVEKPNNPPAPFKQLERGYCSWCLDDFGTEPGSNMMFCAAPVVDKSKREGDRRSSHCVYHYEMSRRKL
jgi:hypothetical protein